MPKLPYAVIYSKIDNCNPVLYIDDIGYHDDTRISGIPIDFDKVIMFNGTLNECINYCKEYAKKNNMFKHIITQRNDDDNGLLFDINWKIYP